MQIPGKARRVGLAFRRAGRWPRRLPAGCFRGSGVGIVETLPAQPRPGLGATPCVIELPWGPSKFVAMCVIHGGTADRIRGVPGGTVGHGESPAGSVADTGGQQLPMWRLNRLCDVG